MIEWEDKVQSYKKCHHLTRNNCNKIILISIEWGLENRWGWYGPVEVVVKLLN